MRSFSQYRDSNWIAQHALKHRLAKQRVQGTGQWLLRRQEYLDWCDLESPALLWLSGAPGSGKSTLASLIIDHAYERNYQPIFFFGDLQQTKGDLAVNLLRSMAYQLGLPLQQPLISETYQDHTSRTETHLWLEVFQGRFRSLLESVQPSANVVFIIDGLDESSINMTIYDEIINASISPNWRSKCHCVILNRQRAPGGVLLKEINLDEEISVRRDISHFVMEELQEHIRWYRNQQRQLAKVHKSILLKADGLFLWAKLAVNHVILSQSASDPVMRAKSLEQTVSGLCQQILEQVSSEYNTFAKAALSWIALARRPLKLSEIRKAIEIGSFEPTRDESNIETMSEEIISKAFGGFVQVAEDGSCYFVHSAVQEFLVSSTRTNCDPYLPKKKAHDYLARTCLAFLQVSTDLHTSSQGGERDITTLGDYAKKYWSHHLSQAVDSEKIITDQLQVALVNTWTKLVLRRDILKAEEYADMLFSLGVFHGLPSLLRISLSSGKTTNSKLTHDCSSPLFSTNRCEPFNNSPYSCTRSNGTEDAEYSHWTPLHWAAMRGHHETVQLLLSSKSQINLEQDSGGWTALHCAAYYGRHNIVEILLNEGADLNARTRETGETALHIAAKAGDLQCLRYLLDRRGPSESQVTIYEDIIKRSYFRSWSEAVLSNSNPKDKFVWDIDSRDQAESDMQNLVSETHGYLNINAVDTYGHTALHLALSNGHVPIAEILIARGADCYSKNVAGCTPLSLAIQDGQMKSVGALLIRGWICQEPLRDIINFLDRQEEDCRLADMLLWQRFVTDISGGKCQSQAMKLPVESTSGVLRTAKHHARTHTLFKSSDVQKLRF